MKANVIILTSGLGGLYLQRRIPRERAVTVITGLGPDVKDVPDPGGEQGFSVGSKPVDVRVGLRRFGCLDR